MTLKKGESKRKDCSNVCTNVTDKDGLSPYTWRSVNILILFIRRCFAFRFRFISTFERMYWYIGVIIILNSDYQISNVNPTQIFLTYLYAVVNIHSKTVRWNSNGIMYRFYYYYDECDFIENWMRVFALACNSF